MKTLMAALLGILLVGCQTPPPTITHLGYTGGDGSSPQQSVVIIDAKIREVGGLAERLWLEHRYPGYHEMKRESLDEASRHYDLVEFATADGATKTVYFDASEFFGK
jgi:hypothetical protein